MGVAVFAERKALVEADAGPKERLVELMDRYERPLCAYLGVILNDSDAVFDCAQDAFLRAYEHLEKGKSINSQWLYKVARNRAIDRIRQQGKFDPDGEVLDEIAGSSTGVSDRELKVREILAQLSLDDRELLYLSIVDRFRTDEIGAMLGIRAGAARVRIHRARERFRTYYVSNQ